MRRSASVGAAPACAAPTAASTSTATRRPRRCDRRPIRPAVLTGFADPSRGPAGSRDGTYTSPAMATTEHEAVPTVSADAAASPLATVVMKFGGTSVADSQKLKAVAGRLAAARAAGNRVVG